MALRNPPIRLKKEYTAIAAPFTLQVGNLRFPVSVEDVAKLYRDAATLRQFIGLDTDSGPPYVLVVRIPYLDVDNEQTTDAWTTPIAVNSRELLVDIEALLSVELVAMGFTAEAGYIGGRAPTFHVDPVPEISFFVEDLEASPDSAHALAVFRRRVACNSSHVPDDSWWETLGIDTETDFASLPLQAWMRPRNRQLSPGWVRNRIGSLSADERDELLENVLWNAFGDLADDGETKLYRPDRPAAAADIDNLVAGLREDFFDRAPGAGFTDGE